MSRKSNSKGANLFFDEVLDPSGKIMYGRDALDVLDDLERVLSEQQKQPTMQQVRAQFMSPELSHFLADVVNAEEFYALPLNQQHDAQDAMDNINTLNQLDPQILKYLQPIINVTAKRVGYIL